MFTYFTSDILMAVYNIKSFLKGFHSIGSFTSGDKKSPVKFTQPSRNIILLLYS